MTTRRERVVLELSDAGFSTGMARAAAATALLDRNLNALDGSGIRTRGGLQRTEQDVTRLGRAMDQSGASIDRYSGRLEAIAKAAFVLGPALVPLGGVAIQGVAGLASQLGFAAIGAGSLVVAVQGVGDALKTFNAASLNPTVENIAKAREAMEALGPDAQNFVLRFQELRPALTDIRDAAASGWFPGLTEALDDVERSAPGIERFFAKLGEVGGGLISDAADSVTGPEWAEFRSFVEQEAPQALDDLGRSVGHLVKGLAEMWMAFDPLNDDFSAWLLRISEDFDRWASGLAETQGFEDFVEYIRRNGPQVAETMGALGNAVVAIVKAAAPLGGPVLEAIELVADALRFIAETPIGPKIYTMAAAFMVLNRALSMTAGLMAKAGFAGTAGALRGAMPGGAGPAGSAAAMTPLGARVQATRGQITGLRRDMTALRSVNRDIRSMGLVPGAMSQRETARMNALTAQRTQLLQQQRTAMAGVGRAAGVGAAGVAAFAVASGQLGGGLGLQNAAMLGLVGSMTGPWGAAIGATTGLIIDMRAEARATTEQIKAFDTALASATSLQQVGAAASAQNAAWNKARGDYSSFGSGVMSALTNPSEFYNIGADFISDGDIDRFNDLAGAAMGANAATTDLARTFMRADLLTDRVDWNMADIVAPDLDDVQKSVDYYLPAMERLKVSLQDISNMSESEQIDFGHKLVNEMRLIAQESAGLMTVTGRTKALEDAFKGLEGSIPSPDAVTAFVDALNGLIDPELNASRASDQWAASLRHLKDDLAENSRAMTGNSDAAIQNREAINQRVDALKATLSADAANGASAAQLAKKFQNQRKALLDAADAAGLSRKEVRKYLDQLNLTPELVETLIKANTEDAAGKLRTLKAYLDAIQSKTVTVTMRTINTRNQGAQLGLYADGGFVPKTGLPYADRHLYMLADGEGVTTNRRGETDRFRDVIAGINAGMSRRAVKGMLADGGFTGSPSAAPFFSTIHANPLNAAANAAFHLAHGLKALEKQQGRVEKQLAAEEKARDKYVSKIRDYTSQVRDNFRTDPFAERESGNVWTSSTLGGMDPLATLRADIKGGREFKKLTDRLRDRGLDGQALLEVDTLDEARALAAMSRKELKDFERLYGVRQRLTQGLGEANANAVYGDKLDAAVRELKQTKSELKQIKAAIRDEHKKDRKNRDDNTKKAKGAERASARSAAQRRGN